MKKLIVCMFLIVFFAVSLSPAIGGSSGPAGPAPNSGDGVSDGGVGPAPNSGDGVSDGSGF